MNLPRIANSSPLDGLPEEAVVDFISHAKSQTFAKGEIILEQGAEGDKLYLIVSGRVSVSVLDADVVSDADAVSTRRIAMLGAGEIFGESAVLANDTRTATVKAATFVDTMAVSASDYENLVAKHPMLQQNVCRILGKRMASPKHQADSSAAIAAMSIAVVIENAAGWEVARAVSRELNGWSSSCRPMVLASTKGEAEQRHRESPVCNFDIQPVAHENLPACVAAGVASATPIVIALDPQSAAVAARECDQVIMLADAESTSSWVAQFSRRLAPGNHILARMFRQTSAVKPYNCPANVRELRFKTSENQQLNSDAITRLLRAIRGQRIGLALGGGGARGIAHIGVLEVLTEEGIVFDQVAGTSAGAIVGAAYASGIPMSSVAEMYRRDFVPPRLLAMHPLGRRLFLMGAFRGNRLEQIFRSNLDSVQFDQLEIPLSINAADLISGKSIVRESGDVVRAILESINHPVFGRPIMTSGQAIVDGGILGNVPAAALSATCDRVISVDVGSRLSDHYGRDKDGGLRRPSYLSTVLRSIDVSKKHTSRSHQTVSDYVITPEVQGYRLEDFHATDALIEIGRQAALDSLAELKQAIAINEPGV